MFTARLSQKLSHLVWPGLKAGELRERCDLYLEKWLYDMRGVDTDDALEVLPVNMGRNTLVRCVKLSPDERVFARAWRYDRVGLPARTHASAGISLQKVGIRIPEVLVCDDSFETIRRYRLETVIERKAAGITLDEKIRLTAGELPRPIVEVLAGEIACLHTPGGRNWGSPWSPRDKMKKPLDYWQDRIKKVSQRIRTGSMLLDLQQINLLTRRLQKMLKSVRFVRPVLVHGDLSPSHIFIDKSARITLIDFETVHFGHAGMDLAWVRNWFRDAFRWKIFAEIYSSRTGVPIDLGALEYFDLMRMVEKLSSRIVKRTHRPMRFAVERDQRLKQEQERVEKRLIRLLED